MFKVIYWGLPMMLCENEEEPCLDGFWLFLVEYLPAPNGESFVFFKYEGSYLNGLYHYILGK